MQTSSGPLVPSTVSEEPFDDSRETVLFCIRHDKRLLGLMAPKSPDFSSPLRNMEGSRTKEKELSWISTVVEGIVPERMSWIFMNHRISNAHDTCTKTDQYIKYKPARTKYFKKVV